MKWWDSLYKRYSDPMQLLQQMIDTGQFAEMIDGMQDAVNEETMWEFYLHKVQDISFDTFKARLMQPVETSKNDLEATVKHSFEMMENFHPK